jgi:hypothetical protein
LGFASLQRGSTVCSGITFHSSRHDGGLVTVAFFAFSQHASNIASGVLCVSLLSAASIWDFLNRSVVVVVSLREGEMFIPPILSADSWEILNKGARTVG